MNDVRKIGLITAKKKILDHILTPYTRINANWNKGLNVRLKTTKILADNTGHKISNISHTSSFSDTFPRARKTKEQNKQMGLYQTKMFFSSFFSFSFFNCCSSTVVSIFCPPLPTIATHLHLPSSILLPLALSMCLLYMVLDNPSSISHYPSPPPPLVTVNLFLISMSLVLFCLLACLVD